MRSALPRRIHGAEVTEGPISALVDDPLVSFGGVEAEFELTMSPVQALCRLPGGGRFWIERGKRVVVDAAAGDQPNPWLHATVSAILLAQQGRFALHANVVDIGGFVVAICGQRRAGKSTTSLALSTRGHRLVTDDVAALDIEPEGVIHRSAGRPVHVHPSTAELLGVSLEGAIGVPGDPGKLALPNPASPPVPLHAVILLRAAPREDVSLTRLSTGQGAQAVHFHAYRRQMLDPLWQAQAFQWAAEVASRVPAWLVVRPQSRWSIDEVCSAIEGLRTEAPHTPPHQGGGEPWPITGTSNDLSGET